MGITGTNLRKGRRRLRLLNKAMRRSDSKAEVFDLDIYRDSIYDELKSVRRRR